MSNRHDDLNLEFTKLLSISQKQETELELLSKCSNEMKQMKKAEIKKWDELEQYDQRQNLKIGWYSIRSKRKSAKYCSPTRTKTGNWLRNTKNRHINCPSST